MSKRMLCPRIIRRAFGDLSRKCLFSSLLTIPNYGSARMSRPACALCMRFVQAFRKELIESGAVIEIKRGTLLAHTDYFGSVAFALLACLPLPKFETTVRSDRPAFVPPPPVPGRKRGRPRRAD